MKSNIFILAAMMAMSCACTNQVEDLAKQEDSTLKVTTYIANEGTRSQSGFVPKTQFKTNDKMGLFLYKETWGSSYVGISKQNNLSTYNGKWSQETPYYLNADNAHVWAYYPYDQTVTDGKKVPVSIEGNNANTDYMYGQTKKQVSVLNSVAEIQMKHAMSQFVIRMKPSPDYHNSGSTPGKLTNITIKSKTGSSVLYKTGELDITTGIITGKTSSQSLSWVPNIMLESNQNHDYCATIFPKVVAQNELVVEITVDAAKYTFDIPAIQWQKGYRYIYAFQMKSNGVVIGGTDGSNVTIESWKDSAQNDVELIPAK